MHETVMNFGSSLTGALVRGKRVLEVGSYNVNGSIRDRIGPLGPARYVGVDISEGPGVDMVCSAVELENRFGKNSFDIIVSTEMLEHAADWKLSIVNMKSCLVVGGYMLLTTRSAGFGYHNPPDHWRFEYSDMARIFADFETINLCKDPQVPGVFFFGRKISDTVADLTDFEVAKMEVPR